MECLEDIEAALYFDYPDNMRYKLLDRQAKCYVALGQGKKKKIEKKLSLIIITIIIFWSP